MFINKLNQLYKPKRILFYLEADDAKLNDFYMGVLPDELKKYSNAFGTYDNPGVFYLKALNQPVIGIEYRMNDPEAIYPTELKQIVLNESFFYSVEIDNEVEISTEKINSLFRKIAEDDDAHRLYSDLLIEENPEIISVFADYKKNRILYEGKIYQDRAKYVINQDPEHLDKTSLYELAFFDKITGHYNWNHLVAYLEMPMNHGIHDYTFVHFDIKEFRVINEVYGHIVANKVLCNVVNAMKEADFIYASARCHNDNFAMMIKDMPLEKTIEKLKDFYQKLSVLEEDPNYKIYYRCGVVPMQKSMLLGNRVADAAKMAQAMGRTPNQTDITIYTDKMHDDLSWGNFIKAYLETAIQNDEFLVYLQPKFNVVKNEVCGAEALIRWNYRNRDFLPPGKFVPFFERDGSIGKIDDIVLSKVCKTLAEWKREGKKLIPISVNLSRSRLNDQTLTGNLTASIDKYGIPHELIDFELTESAAYDNTEQMIKVLEDLKSKGFKISMDDFGTGYSSFSLLTQIPLDTLKIDKSFVDKIAVEGEKKEDIAVARHIISLAKELGFECLAEGAERKEQVDKLLELGCSKIQGYYYGKPKPIKEFEEKFLV
ncbi:MAG: EAL domain-containing protein [Treponema sp.]|nr:EAL domain-containing protein [Treponema sp.]